MLRFLVDDRGILLLAVIPVSILGMLYGLRGALAAASLASGAYLIWADGQGLTAPLDLADQPLTLFVLGFVSGYFAHGALGHHDLGDFAANHRLRKAMASGELVLHYQPIVSTSSGELIAVEALARWQDPRRGTVPPLDYIPTAERDPATIWRFTLHTLDLASRDAVRLGLGDGVLLTVNISPAALDYPDFPDALREIVRRHHLDPHRFAVELTETAMTGGEQSLVDSLTRIRDLGLGLVAIDDFGVGESSLARLDLLPIDVLKFDRRLTSRAESPRTRALLEAMVGLAHSLELVVVGEGVEDERTARLLTEIGCDAIQGYHVSYPLPAAELARCRFPVG